MGLWEIPAGKIREYENIYSALRREVKEETNLDITYIAGEETCETCSSSGYMQTATFCGQQGRISRTVRAILNGQPGISAGQRVVRPTDQYCSLFQQKAMLSQSVQ